MELSEVELNDEEPELTLLIEELDNDRLLLEMDEFDEDEEELDEPDDDDELLEDSESHFRVR